MFAPPSVQYQLVSGGSGSPCSTPADCTSRFANACIEPQVKLTRHSGEVCGSAVMLAGGQPTNAVAQVCGLLTGYWSYAKLVCHCAYFRSTGHSSPQCKWTSPGAYGNCSTVVPGQHQALAKLFTLLQAAWIHSAICRPAWVPIRRRATRPTPVQTVVAVQTGLPCSTSRPPPCMS